MFVSVAQLIIEPRPLIMDNMAVVPHLHQLVQRKEQELQVIREEETQALETAIKTSEEELEAERGKRKALEDDFKYNLHLIEQRDQELLQYETVFQQLKKVRPSLPSLIIVIIHCLGY